jgi:hypothetical protein
MAGNKAGDCLRPPLVDTLSEECKQLKYTYGICKRNLIDMRKRFRGPMPAGYQSKRETPGGQQLYAGIGDKRTDKTVEEELDQLGGTTGTDSSAR